MADVSVEVHSFLKNNRKTRIDFPLTQGTWAVSIDSITIKPLEDIEKLSVTLKLDIVISDQYVEEDGDLQVRKLLTLPSPLHSVILEAHRGKPSVLLSPRARDFHIVNNPSAELKVFLEDSETKKEIKPMLSLHTILKFKRMQ